MPNRPIEMFFILRLLGASFAQNYWLYAKRYCNGYRHRHGVEVGGASNLGELQRKLREEVMLRRRKADVLTELPPKQRQVIELEVPASVRDIVTEQAEWLRENDATVGTCYTAFSSVAATRKPKFSDSSKERHRIALAKVPQVVKHVKDQLELHEKIILFAHHHDVIDKIAEAFGPAAVRLTGKETDKQKQAAVDAFQNDPKVKVFIGSIQAAGVGITLTAADLVVFAELDWVQVNMEQAEDRAHRMGQLRSLLIQYLMLSGSIEARMANVLARKEDIADQALNLH
jgi:SWI/SNF-related matrix-associated actin-dependent regulator 1 of chromatin subfamily A